MVVNINKLGKDIKKTIGATVIVALMLSCRTTSQINYTKDIVTEYKDTAITVPLETHSFDIEDITKDTTIAYDDVRLQIIHDTDLTARIIYMKSPQLIKLDSVIKTVTIKEVYRITKEKQACHSKFHHFSTAFFEWTISIVLLYVGLKALTK